jgi:hypothetical protein
MMIGPSAPSEPPLCDVAPVSELSESVWSWPEIWRSLQAQTANKKVLFATSPRQLSGAPGTGTSGPLPLQKLASPNPASPPSC